MIRRRWIQLLGLMVVAAMFTTMFAQAPRVLAVSPNIVISQVYGGGGNSGAQYTHDFIELFNRGLTEASLKGLSLQYASATGTGNFGASTTQLTELPDVMLAAGQYFLVQEAGGITGAPLPSADLTDPTPISMAAGAGKVALATGTTTLGCNGGSTQCTAEQSARIIDLVGFGTANYYEGSAAAPALSNTTAALRNGNGCSDTDDNRADFTAGPPAPHNTVSPLNPCGGPPPSEDITASADPPVITTPVGTAATSALSASDPDSIVTDTGITSAPVPGISLDNFTAASVDGQAATATLNVSSSTAPGTYSVVVEFANNEGQTKTVSVSVTVTASNSCTAAARPIHEIQGSGAETALAGQTVTIQGIVTGLFPGLSGIYVQEEPAEADSNAATSEGIFVFLSSGFASKTTDLTAGDTVRVSGVAGEYSTSDGVSKQTQISGSRAVSGSPTVTECAVAPAPIMPMELTFPLKALSDLEAYEGMLVRFPQELAIAEYFNYDRFGELVLGYGGDIAALEGKNRFYTPSSIVEPGEATAALQQQYDLRQITLDDGLSSQNPSALRHPNGNSFTLTNRFRGGDLVDEVTGVIDQTFGLYRVQPTAPAVYNAVNARPPEPSDVGGRLHVGAFNTLNYFLTIDTTASDNSGPCGASQTLDCRGADNEEEFNRQRVKLLQALIGLDADILGLNELENTPGVEPLADIVAGLNETLGPGTYAYIETGVIGTDAIKVGYIYKPAVVTPVGDEAILNSTVDPRFVDTRNRPSLAQTFEENATGARFTAVVNHLKSKGSGCGVGDDDTQQGNCNGTRTDAAMALVDWLATDPTGSADQDYLIVGDLNSYDQEDPIDAIKAGADDIPGTADDYIDLVEKYNGEFAYSYVFDGQLGYLDYALAITSLAPQVTGATEWHINADEPDVLDYDTSFKPDAQDALYEANAFRTSDHDPVLVGLALASYNFNGFFPPVDNLPAVNSVKVGRAVPLTFSLGGYQGMDVPAQGYPASQRIACDTGEVIGPLEQASTPGASALTYDAKTDTYTYVWKTDKAWAGTCRQLVFKLDIGTYHRANFQFR